MLHAALAGARAAPMTILLVQWARMPSLLPMWWWVGGMAGRPTPQPAGGRWRGCWRRCVRPPRPVSRAPGAPRSCPRGTPGPGPNGTGPPATRPPTAPHHRCHYFRAGPWVWPRRGRPPARRGASGAPTATAGAAPAVAPPPPPPPQPRRRPRWHYCSCRWLQHWVSSSPSSSSSSLALVLFLPPRALPLRATGSRGTAGPGSSPPGAGPAALDRG